MPTLLPWTTMEIGELEVFAPAVPCLVVHTWYMGDQPDSTVIYFWQDEATGMISHEVVYAEPVGFEEALRWAQEHAPQRGVERIHIKHGPSGNRRVRPKTKAAPPQKRKLSLAKKGRSRKMATKTPTRKAKAPDRK
jgi:hypothetical protein